MNVPKSELGHDSSANDEPQRHDWGQNEKGRMSACVQDARVNGLLVSRPLYDPVPYGIQGRGP